MSLANQIDALQDAMMAALVARAATGGAPLNTALGQGQSGQVPIDLGEPPDGKPQPEHVWIAEASEAARIPETSGSVGATFVGEFRQDVYVFVQLSGTYKQTRDRSTLLADDVEDLLDAPGFYTTAGLLDGYTETVKRDTGTPTADSRGAMVTLTFFCRTYPA